MDAVDKPLPTVGVPLLEVACAPTRPVQVDLPVVDLKYAQSIIEVLRGRSRSQTSICKATECWPKVVIRTLIALEAAGWVEQDGDMLWSLSDQAQRQVGR
jgi:DNA-binding HxlR family transcriptional regulator